MGRQRRLGWIYRVAATLLILGMFSAIAYYFSGTKKNVEPAVSTVIKENLRGRKSTIFLNDGSIVYLNSESSIEYPEKFSDSLRVVKISGEAFFDIARDEHKPFIVHTDELAISVLGTSFNVNDFDENDRCKISLSSGKVSVSTLGQTQGSTADAITLSPGQSVSYLEEKAEFTSITAFDPNLDLGWKDGNIVFKNADMQTMLKTFERWYNVDFKLKNDPYFRWNYTGEFHNQTLQDVLESLSFSQSFDFRFEENNVELMFKPN
jgi:ferric-dicitrate binding protein FerR (iron transport regulator)